MSAADGGLDASSFAELFNARCVELGLLNAPEIAQRIVKVQPAMGRVDLARSVRNWQAGRNVPRPDFYRIILRALEVDKDKELSAEWHRVYSEARAARARKASGLADAERGPSESLAPFGESSIPSDTMSGSHGRPYGTPDMDMPGSATFEPAAWVDSAAPAEPEQDAERAGAAFADARLFGVVVIMTVLLVAAALGTSRYVAGAAFGEQCDRLASASWDPQRNRAVGTSSILDIGPQAIEMCERAALQNPREGRYWFQLGRAHARDARRHGNYADAHWALRRAHRLDYSASSLSLGMLHEDGLLGTSEGVSPQSSLATASRFYREAAAANLPMGHYCHAISTLFGWSGESPDPARALISAEAAVEAGSTRALALVADLRARRPTTRHVECSQERGVAVALKKIAWSDDPS